MDNINELSIEILEKAIKQLKALQKPKKRKPKKDYLLGTGLNIKILPDNFFTGYKDIEYHEYFGLRNYYGIKNDKEI